MKRLIVAGITGVVLLSGCGDGGEKYRKEAAELRSGIEDLRTQLSLASNRVKELESENLRLKQTPHLLFANVREALDRKNETEVGAAVNALKSKYPDSPETAQASKLLNNMISERQAKEKETEKLAALGFKGIPVQNTFTGTSSAINLLSAKLGGRWQFNDHGDEYEYRDAERGAQYVTAQVTYSSKEKDPSLMAMAVYAPRDGKLKRLGEMGFEFVKWESFATFLGNYHDSGNDFAHSEKIRFSMGVQVQNDEVVKPLYIIAAKKGCANRDEDRFGRPPVKYVTYSCQSLPTELSLNDFTSGEYGVVKRFD
ncbi:Lipoprotein [Pseudomonas sp. IT-P74]|uniref:hypothetical protein n=1 Tax=Pseudomonas sp. IT-P74 TaxID=3026445 RepID=UPI0039E1B110